MAHNGRRNADEALATLLASGTTIRDAAAQLGVSERTAARRMADPGFRTRVDEIRSEMTARAVGRVADAMCQAADALRELLQGQSESVRLGAARSILELGDKLTKRESDNKKELPPLENVLRALPFSLAQKIREALATEP